MGQPIPFQLAIREWNENFDQNQHLTFKISFCLDIKRSNSKLNGHCILRYVQCIHGTVIMLLYYCHHLENSQPVQPLSEEWQFHNENCDAIAIFGLKNGCMAARLKEKLRPTRSDRKVPKARRGQKATERNKY